MFQHVADHKMVGRTLWDEMIVHYDTGVTTVGDGKTLAAMKPFVDEERWSQTDAFWRSSKRKRNGGATLHRLL